ncbi:hypothetical protein CO610_08185 [Lysobacteraceae bacterium NML95-0200]|nr:hypothetical protein CO610_08185 [Xanthomonadaceae bacterium NML95-0200]
MTVESSTAVDVWRMVSARRVFEGELPLAAMPRLCEALLDAEGIARYRMEFGRDALGVAYVALQVEAELPLQCQRSLQRFLLPITLRENLGLIREEADEAALPPGYEPLLLPADARIVPAELVEDELILALPVVAVAPGSEAVAHDWPVSAPEAAASHPFAALAALKQGKE